MQTFEKMTHLSISEAKQLSSTLQCNISIYLSVCLIIDKYNLTFTCLWWGRGGGSNAVFCHFY
jgi:hypothetical protein